MREGERERRGKIRTSRIVSFDMRFRHYFLNVPSARIRKIGLEQNNISKGHVKDLATLVHARFYRLSKTRD